MASSGNAAVSGARTVSQAGVRATAAGPPPGGGDERRSTARENSRLAMTATERPATAHLSLWRPGRSGPTREGGPDAVATQPGNCKRAVRVAIFPHLWHDFM